MSNTDKKSDKSLRDFPEIATEIACYIGNFNTIEVMLHLIFSQMINDNVGITHAFLSPWKSFSQKLDIIISIAKLYGENNQAKAILDNEQNMKDANTFRNLLAHSAYSVETGTVEALSYIVSKRKPNTTAITIAAINENRAILRKVFDAFFANVRHGDLGTGSSVYHRPE